jgi:hypothetical protein
MQMKKTAFIAAFVAAFAPQAMSSLARAASTNAPPVNIQNFPEDILQDSVTVYVTPRGQQLFSKGVPLLRQNGVQINNGYIPEWDYAATQPIDIQNLPVNMAGQKTTLEAIQATLKKNLPSFKPFNNPKIKLKVKGINYEAQITQLALAPDLNETRFYHTDNMIVVEAQIQATKLKMGVNSIVLNDTANLLFNNGDIGLNSLSINAAVDQPITFTIPIGISLDAQSHISIQALRVDNNISAVDAALNYKKLNLPPFQFTVTDPTDKHASKDGKKMSISWGQFDPEIRAQLPPVAKATTAYLSSWVQENGIGVVNSAISTQVDVNSVFQEVNTMSPPGAPNGTTPVPYMWGMQPHTFSLTDSFLSMQINTFIEDPLSAEHIALPTGDRAKGVPNLSAVDASTYDVALQLDEAFVNRLLQLSYLRGYFNSIDQTGGDPLKLVVAPTITADGTTSPDHLKMHVVLDYTNIPQGLISKIVDSAIIKNPLQITFDMDVTIQTDPKAGTITLSEGPIDVDSAQVDPNGIKMKMFTNKVMDTVHSSLTAFNQGLSATPSSLTSPIVIPTTIGGVPIVLKTAQADPSGNIMVYAEYGVMK